MLVLLLAITNLFWQMRQLRLNMLLLTVLKNDYYVNSGQKAEVNGYVNALKPIEDANE